jgi:hypothetical protein
LYCELEITKSAVPRVLAGALIMYSHSWTHSG